MKFGLDEQIPIRHRACDCEVWAGILRTSAKFNFLFLEFPRQALGDATLCGKPPRLFAFSNSALRGQNLREQLQSRTEGAPVQADWTTRPH